MFLMDNTLVKIANGNFHRSPSLRAAKLYPANITDLRREVHEIVDGLPYSSVSAGHITNWTDPIGEVRQWSLWNRHGKTDDTSDDFSYAMAGRHVPHAGRFPALDSFIRSHPDLVNMRLNMLSAGSALSPHEEHLPRKKAQGKVSLRARFHLPIDTNPFAKMFADDRWFHFEEGNVYFFNNGCVHAARNGGETSRLHLVWDMLMTERAYNQMFSRGYEELPYEVEHVTEYARSSGMTAQEFDRYDMVYE
jgi:hypothetical protein